MDLPGGQTVGIVKRVYVSGAGRFTAKTLVEPEPVIPIDGCLVEPEHLYEEQSETTVDREIAWIFLPVTDDTQALTPADALKYPITGGRVYEMRGPSTIEYNLDGEPVQVWCRCEWMSG